jgi:hypothetical protein
MCCAVVYVLCGCACAVRLCTRCAIVYALCEGVSDWIHTNTDHCLVALCICVRTNAHRFKPHRDSGGGAGQGVSLIVGLGDFSGGELVVEGKRPFDIRYKVCSIPAAGYSTVGYSTVGSSRIQHSSHTLLSYTPPIHSSHTLLPYTLSHTPLSYTPLTHPLSQLTSATSHFCSTDGSRSTGHR